ncbi:MAG: YfcE family phosphodiesterase [Archaeoglobaceae archaeon]
MALILILGDSHIPRRASWFPKEFEDLFAKRFDFVVCTGDLTDKTVLEYLRRLGKTIAVRGNMDHLPLPEYEELRIGELKLGVIHGDQVYPRGNREQLMEIALEKGVDLLISGHTHSPDFFKRSVVLLNPGSVTGVWGGGGGSLNPSFMLLDTDKMIVELYELKKGLHKRVFEI